MLFLVFEADGNRFALAASGIVQVLPAVRVSGIPGAPAGIAGVAVYAGSTVPVVDLTRLLGGRPSAPRFDTRMIVVVYRDRRGDERLLALLAEHATSTIRRSPADFVDSGVSPAAERYLGPVTTDDHGVIQLIDVPALLPPAVADALFTEPAGTSWASSTSSRS